MGQLLKVLIVEIPLGPDFDGQLTTMLLFFLTCVTAEGFLSLYAAITPRASGTVSLKCSSPVWRENRTGLFCR